jgi:hypothetical protein
MLLTYPLRFRLGEFTLFSVPLALVESYRDTIDLSSRPDDLRQTVGEDTDGPLFRSARISGRSPAIKIGRNCIRYTPYRFKRYFLELTGNYETYLKKFSAKSRSTLRRKVRKFETLSGGKIDWRVYRTPEEMAEFHRLGRQLSARTYQEQLLDAGLPGDTEFVADMQKRAADGSALGFIVFLDDRPVSYLYAPVNRDIVVYAFLGYDQEVATHSPGTVLLLLIIEWLFAQGRYKALDFTEGESEHKAFFSTDNVDCADVLVLRRQTLLWLIVKLHWLTNATSDALVSMLDRLGVKQRLKRFIRRQASLWGGSRAAVTESGQA